MVDKREFIEKVGHHRNAKSSQDRRLVHDLVKLIYTTEEEEGVALITDLLRQLPCNKTDRNDPSVDTQTGRLTSEGPLSPRQFQVGPLVFRLLHIFRDIQTAQQLFHDKELKPLFMNTTCHLLLMDMLYEAGHHEQVVDSFTALQQAEISAKFPPDCTTLAMAALYKMNTAESFHKMKRLMREAKMAGCTLSRRSLLFAAALALRQRDGQCALDISQSDSNLRETVFRNIKVMALAQLGKLEEAVVTVEEGLEKKIPTSRTSVIYSDTVTAVANQLVSNSQPVLKRKFEAVQTGLEEEGLLSPQTVEHFVNRPVLRQRRPEMSQSFKTRLKSPLKIRQK